jgi:8-oxo-dGTP diphosphatase
LVTPKDLGAAVVVLDDAGRILLVKHTYGRLNWELPGGGAETGESTEETALREVREETGLTVAIERLAGIYYDRAADMHHFVFACRRADPSAMPRADGDEIAACGYWPVEALPRPISDFTIRRIHDALAAPPDSVIAVPPRQWLE